MLSHIQSWITKKNWSFIDTLNVRECWSFFVLSVYLFPGIFIFNNLNLAEIGCQKRFVYRKCLFKVMLKWMLFPFSPYTILRLNWNDLASSERSKKHSWLSFQPNLNRKLNRAHRNSKKAKIIPAFVIAKLFINA